MNNYIKISELSPEEYQTYKQMVKELLQIRREMVKEGYPLEIGGGDRKRNRKIA